MYLAIIAKGDVAALRKLLREHPESLSQRGNHNRTLLWEGWRSSRIEVVIFVIDQGADVNAIGCYNSESYVQI